MANRTQTNRRNRVRKSTSPSPRARKLVAQAFNDAVRDILAADGIFSLADEQSPGTLYHFDGVTWKREELPRAKRARRPSAEPLRAVG